MIIGVIGNVQILTRIAYEEIQHVSRCGPFIIELFCVMNGSRGVRNIRLCFFSASLMRLFEFTLEQFEIHNSNSELYDDSSSDLLANRIRYTREVLAIPVPRVNIGVTGVDSWNAVSWVEDERISRAVHPFYNEQLVCVSVLSSELREWLSDGEAQDLFYTGCLREGIGRTLVCRSPIEASIDSYLYGWGSWLRRDGEK